MSDPNSLLVPALIFGCLFLSVVTTLVPLEIISRLDKSPRSGGDQFSEEMAKVILPLTMMLASVIPLVMALEAGTTLAMVLSLVFSALVGPCFLAGISAFERLCQSASRLIEKRAARQTA